VFWLQVCRRAERRVVELSHSQAVQPEVQRFVNRLSDFLFMAARLACLRQGHRELIYKAATPRRGAVLESSSPPTSATTPGQ
jgi:cob(I)alamin adenosyltransferase